MITNKLREFEEYLMAFDMYEGHRCDCCSKLMYICLYKQIYRRIVSRELSPEELLGVQREVFQIIIDLRKKEENCVFFDVNNMVRMFRMLINTSLQVYILGPDPYNMVVLNEDQKYDNDLFNEKEIASLLNNAEEYLRTHKKVHLIISDLCLGNLQFGDFITNEHGRINGVEVKRGRKNKRISKRVYKGKNKGS